MISEFVAELKFRGLKHLPEFDRQYVSVFVGECRQLADHGLHNANMFSFDSGRAVGFEYHHSAWPNHRFMVVRSEHEAALPVFIKEYDDERVAIRKYFLAATKHHDGIMPLCYAVRNEDVLDSEVKQGVMNVMSRDKSLFLRMRNHPIFTLDVLQDAGVKFPLHWFSSLTEIIDLTCRGMIRSDCRSIAQIVHIEEIGMMPIYAVLDRHIENVHLRDNYIPTFLVQFARDNRMLDQFYARYPRFLEYPLYPCLRYYNGRNMYATVLSIEHLEDLVALEGWTNELVELVHYVNKYDFIFGGQVHKFMGSRGDFPHSGMCSP